MPSSRQPLRRFRLDRASGGATGATIHRSPSRSSACKMSIIHPVLRMYPTICACPLYLRSSPLSLVA